MFFVLYFFDVLYLLMLCAFWCSFLFLLKQKRRKLQI